MPLTPLVQRYGQVHEVLEQNGLPAYDFHEVDGAGGGEGGPEPEDGDGGADGHEAVFEHENGRDGDDDEAEVAAEADADIGVEADIDTNTNRDNTSQNSGDALFWPTYNFAPGYRGVVIRPVRRRQPKRDGKMPPKTGDLRVQMQVMKWGLVPSWMRRRPDYATMLKTINCRADSLAPGNSKGMWAALRGRKRCVVVADGFYEWLAKGPKERVPHYIRRRDGLPLLMAGLWDVVTWDDQDEKNGTRRKTVEYTYTIITTDSSPSLRFLHDRMPVLFDYHSPELAKWLDASRDEWSAELQDLLRPWPVHDEDEDEDGKESRPGGTLLVDVVSKEVNRAGHSSASFVVPVASADNKANIANFFRQKGPAKEEMKGKNEKGMNKKTNEKEMKENNENTSEKDNNSSVQTPKKRPPSPIKESLKKARKASPKPSGPSPSPSISATTPTTSKPPGKTGRATARTASDKPTAGSQKITSFFGPPTPSKKHKEEKGK